ncbi:hypothetical protein DPMN_116835 [Dreissena polymorpha]|uniref:Uncharacterized protein n=1 Tax=Dreissena polymorpha TaxID=45954 RepID=A0A9D4KP96_DREPO|nr:hypothetical protein DPMN_116835 [Dreissena polymorpha]
MINNTGGPGWVNYFFGNTECSKDQLNLKKMEILACRTIHQVSTISFIADRLIRWKLT